MAFFKLRKSGDEQTAPAPQPENVDVLRRRAKNRLIGAAILVLIGVVGFPLLVDKHPRPVTVDLPIEIPDKNKVLPLPAPVPEPAAVAATPEPEPAPAVSAAPKVAEKPVAKPESKPAKPAARSESKPAVEGRYVVQAGSFADEGRARDARLKLERAGMKSFIQVVETKEGRRVRVRVGPFATKAEAERAAEKCRKLDLQGAVLSL